MPTDRSQPYEPHEFIPGDFGMFCDVCGRLRVADVHLPADHPDAVQPDSTDREDW
jgi:hypothetical protein